MKKYLEYNSVQSNFYLFNFNIFLFSFFVLYLFNSCSQKSTAEKEYQKIFDATVMVFGLDSNDQQVSQSKGIVIKDKGYVITNYHVLVGSHRLALVHNEENVPYDDIIGLNRDLDVLIIKIGENEFPAIKTCEVKKLYTGQKVNVMGRNYNQENTISEGRIISLNKKSKTDNKLIEITTKFIGWVIGCAVVNEKGELIGIISKSGAKSDGSYINYAVPIDEILDMGISSYSKYDVDKKLQDYDKGIDALQKGNLQESIQYFTMLIETYPINEIGYSNRGHVKIELKDYKGAILDFNKAIEINPKFCGAYFNRGVTKYHLSDYRGAILDFNKAIEINPNYGNAYFNRALSKYALSDFEDACLDLSKAGELGDAQAYDLIKKYCN